MQKGSGKNLRVKRSLPFELGELELAVLHHLWLRGPADVNAVHRAIGERRGIRPNTVQSAMARLHRKGLLRRRKVSHAYVYEPSQSRRDLAMNILAEVASRVLRSDMESLVEVLVDLAGRGGDKSLERLSSLLAERRAAIRRPK